jgi:imidazolonepropionase-like amidohydrolase
MNSSRILPLLALLLSAATGCVSAPATIEADFVFDNVNVVPMNEEIVLEGQSVAVRDGIIVAIVDKAKSSSIHAKQRIDGHGNYLMPGISDMHTHLRMEPQDFFDLNLANGITTVFNMGIGDGGGKYDHLGLRADIAAGKLDGPRYLVSGPQLEAPQLQSVAEVKTALEEHAEHGYDTIKVHGDLVPDVYDALVEGAHARGFRLTGHGQHMMPLAQTLRLDAVEHVEEFLYTSRDNRFGEVAEGSVDNYLNAYYENIVRLEDPAYRASIVADVAASGVYWDPTLIIYTMLPIYVTDDTFEAMHADPRLDYLPKETRKSYLDWQNNEYRAGLAPLFRTYLEKVDDDSTLEEHFGRNIEILSEMMLELHNAGVPLLLGSDAFGALVPGFAPHQELELMVAAGLSPYEALRTGTVNAAAYLREADNAGTIETGKRADFILMAANPLDDIGNAAQVRGVFTHAKWHSATELEARMMGVKEHPVSDQ